MVLVVSKGPKLAAVQQEIVVGSRDCSETLLAEIDSPHVVSGCSIFSFDFVGRSDFVSAAPADLDEDRLPIDGLVDHDWVIPAPIRKAKHPSSRS